MLNKKNRGDGEGIEPSSDATLRCFTLALHFPSCDCIWKNTSMCRCVFLCWFLDFSKLFHAISRHICQLSQTATFSLVLASVSPM